MDVSMTLNEIKHELSLLEGYSLPLGKHGIYFERWN